MNPNCVKNGMCPCECEFPDKQLEDRSCDLECYPPLMDKETWKKFKNKQHG